MGTFALCIVCCRYVVCCVLTCFGYGYGCFLCHILCTAVYCGHYHFVLCALLLHMLRDMYCHMFCALGIAASCIVHCVLSYALCHGHCCFMNAMVQTCSITQHTLCKSSRAHATDMWQCTAYYMYLEQKCSWNDVALPTA